jgi:hypothetical protein
MHVLATIQANTTSVAAFPAWLAATVSEGYADEPTVLKRGSRYSLMTFTDAGFSLYRIW